MNYGGLPQLHWQGLVSWEVRREQIAQPRARNPTNLKSKSPPNLKSKNLNLIYKNISKGPIIEKIGKLQDRNRKFAWRIQTPTKANTWKIWFWLQCTTFHQFVIVCPSFSKIFALRKYVQSKRRTLTKLYMFITKSEMDTSSGCRERCDGFLMRGSVWQVKCSYRS